MTEVAVVGGVLGGDFSTPIPQGGVLLRNPATTNNLLPNRFRLAIKRAPNVEFWVQEIEIPGFSIESVGVGTPFVEIPESGEHIAYEDLGISFLVDSELANYFEVYQWLRSLGKPERFGEYARLVKAPIVLDEGVKSDFVVFVLNGMQQPTKKFTFHDAFPYAIGGLRFNSTDPDLSRIVCHTAFKYTYFDLESIT